MPLASPPSSATNLADEVTYTLQEAAQLLGVSAQTIRRRVRSGDLPGKKQPGPRGAEWRVPASALAAAGLAGTAAGPGSTSLWINTGQGLSSAGVLDRASVDRELALTRELLRARDDLVAAQREQIALLRRCLEETERQLKAARREGARPPAEESEAGCLEPRR
jgi:excisionase family DNA binding protein